MTTAPPPPSALQAQSRHFGMDWLRIGAFALLICYHVGLVFGPWPYEIKADETWEWVARPLLALNAWRLSLLFAISGYASAALLARTRAPGRFARERLARLGIPLIAGMAIWVTPQPWVALVTQHGYPHGFGWFLAHDYYAFKEIDGVALPTWMHLWFVVYLLVYTMAFVGLACLPARMRAALRRGGEAALAGPLLLPLGVAWIFLVRLGPGGWTDTHGLFDDPTAHLAYFPVFLFGALLRGSERLRAAIARQWPIAAALALAGYAGVFFADWSYPGDTPLPDSWRLPFLLARATHGWATIVALFGVADRFWNHDHALRPMLAEAVFPFYIIHQTVILVVGYAMVGSGIEGWAAFALLIAATALGCWLFYRIGREIGPLRPLIGLARRRRV